MAHSVFTVEGVGAGDQLGVALAVVGDLDGDGHPDLLAGARPESPERERRGQIRVLSGVDGRRLLARKGAEPGDGFGLAVAGAGDVDADGVPDVIVGSPLDDRGAENGGAVAVLSGRDLSVLLEVTGELDELRLGTAVCGPGDLDGDGRPDFAAGSPQPTDHSGGDGGPGLVRVYSGADGALLHELVGDGPFDDFGAALCGPGDLTGDGVPDLVVGAPGGPGGRPDVVRAIHVHSGVDGQRRSTYRATEPGFGASLAAVGDLDGDGVGDILAGLELAPGDGPLAGGALVLDGREGRRLLAVRGERGYLRLGAQVAAPGDVDGDGTPDLALAGAPGGVVRLYSGDDGRLLCEQSPPLGAHEFGAALAGLGDVDGDGRAEWAVGAPGMGTDETSPGSVAVWRFTTR